MGLLQKLKQTLWSDAPMLTTDACPWCGNPAENRADRVSLDGRHYHGDCAVACLDAGSLPQQGAGPGHTA